MDDTITIERLGLGKVLSIFLVQAFPELKDKEEAVAEVCGEIVNASMNEHFHGLTVNQVKLCVQTCITNMNYMLCLAKNDDPEMLDKLKKDTHFWNREVFKAFHAHDAKFKEAAE